ncbi:MAG: hypothetical protein KIS79_15595 [Burkholderiales bacterium]|nr:hypothetical protein [Burkholderiales bacterium]
MTKTDVESEPRFLQSRWIRIGIAGLVLGTGPLFLAVGISYLMGDKNPNPVGPGILAFLTFWPSVLLIVIGVVVTIRRKARFRGET